MEGCLPFYSLPLEDMFKKGIVSSMSSVTSQAQWGSMKQ